MITPENLEKKRGAFTRKSGWAEITKQLPTEVFIT
jgi:hypothetical protein